ncbi:MAG: hypothetical protein ACI8TQ_003239 [Planctomycetota bacterium]|jgi:hypothetical protein
MDWSLLGTQFCLELGFGVLIALAFVPKAPVGAFFYRVMGTTAMIPILIATLVPVFLGQAKWTDTTVLAGCTALVTYPVYSGPMRGWTWGLALAAALAGSATALASSIWDGGGIETTGALLVASSSALATGTVAGSVALAMVLGHWYLTVPNLSVRHLQRLNLVTIGSMIISLCLVGLTCWMFMDQLDREEAPLFGMWGLFNLGTRVTVGLLLPLLFAGMTMSSLRCQNTRSATGILYASTVLVLIGTALSISLQDSYGVPL